MTTVKAKLHICRESKSGKYPLVIQIIHRRQRRMVPIGIKIEPALFDEPAQKIVYRHHCGLTRPDIRAMNESLEDALAVVNGKVKNCSTLQFTAEDIALWYRMRDEDSYLFTYFEKIVENKIRENKIGTSRAYRSTINSLKAFYGSADIRFSEIDIRFLNAYEHFLLGSGTVRNTVAYYMRNLRTVYNRAVIDGVFKPTDPSLFHKFKLSVTRTAKRALPVELIRQVSELDLSGMPKLALARDLFMASFYLRGIPFVDLAHLREENIVNGNIFYYRRKTGVPVVVKIVPALQVIIDRYAAAGPYLFPCMLATDMTGEARYGEYRKSLLYYNRRLKNIGQLLGIDIPLTGYVARHSWATHAKNKGASTIVISEGLGHASEKITQVYLKSFDHGVLNNLNAIVAELR